MGILVLGLYGVLGIVLAFMMEGRLGCGITRGEALHLNYMYFYLYIGRHVQDLLGMDVWMLHGVYLNIVLILSIDASQSSQNM